MNEYDLDLPADPVARGTTALLPAGLQFQDSAPDRYGPDVVGTLRAGPRGLLGITALAMALLGVAAGAVLAAAPAGRSQPTPLSATLAARDVSAADGAADVVLRLAVENPGVTSAALTALVLDGVEPQRVVVPLSATVAPGQRTVVDVPVRPQCTSSSQQLAIRLMVAGSADGLPVLAAGDLDQSGGLCGLIRSQLPPGYPTAIAATSARLDDVDLVLEVPGLAGKAVAGGPEMDHVVQTSATVGTRLVPATITNGTQLRLPGPAPCFDGQDGDPIPMSARLLVHTPTGLGQQIVLGGPALARWLSVDCPD